MRRCLAPFAGEMFVSVCVPQCVGVSAKRTIREARMRAPLSSPRITAEQVPIVPPMVITESMALIAPEDII